MPSFRFRLLGLVAAAAPLLSLGCQHNDPNANTGPYPGQFGYTPTPVPYGQPAPYGTGQLPPGGAQITPVVPPANLPPVSGDPITVVDVGWLRNDVATVMGLLIAALPATTQARVQGIPIVPDPTPGNVNAFAACDDQGQPLMAVTDGLLDVEAHIAQYKAIDEIWGTQKVSQYEQLLAQTMKSDAPVPRPQPGFTDPSQDSDGRKVARQHQIMDEQLAFVMGHELSHHYLGHTGCANGQGGGTRATPSDVWRLATRVASGLNQFNEIAADRSGTQNLLTAGSRMSGYRWTENGAILTLQFFAALQAITADSVLTAFAQTHPFPQIRLPLVQQAAAEWRATGGQGFQLPNLGGFLPQ